MAITLNKIRTLNPCRPGWKRTLDNFGVTKADNNEFDFIELLETVGIEDSFFAIECATYKELAPFLLLVARHFSAIDKNASPVARKVIIALIVYIQSGDGLDDINELSKSEKSLYSFLCAPKPNFYKISRFCLGIKLNAREKSSPKSLEQIERDLWVELEQLFKSAFY